MYVKKRMSLLLFAALAMVLFTACGRWDFSREAAKAANEAQGETLRVEFTVEQKFTNALRAALEENIQPADVEKAMRADESIKPFLTSGYRLDVYPLRADISAKDAAEQLAAEFVNRLAGCEDEGYISMVKADNGYFYEAVLTYRHSSSGGSSGGDDATTPTYTVTVDAGDGGTVTPESDTITTGGTFEFTVTPEEGFKVSSVTPSSGSVQEIDKEKGTWELSNVTEDTTITVEFAQQTYAVTIKIDPEAGAKVVYERQVVFNNYTIESIAHRSSITFSVQVSEGYEIVSVSSEQKGTTLEPTINKPYDPKYTLSDITSDDTITVSVQTKE